MISKNLTRVLIIGNTNIIPVISDWLEATNASQWCDYRLVDHQSESQKSELSYNAQVLVAINAKPDILSHVLAANPITWVHSLSAGVDQFMKTPEIVAENSKIVLTNAKGSFSQFLAEYGLFGILWHGKRAQHWRNLQKQSTWQQGRVKYCGIQTLGIVGYGDIGYHTAKAVKSALGMKIIALKRDINKIDEEKKKWVDELVDYTGFDHLCKESDYIISVLPSTAETKNFFNKEAFAKMRKNCCFMNFGRGESVVENDLVAALENGVIESAVLDVFTPEPLGKESKLWAMENVFITPHSADNVDNLAGYSLQVWKEHFECWKNGNSLKNLVDVKLGY